MPDTDTYHPAVALLREMIRFPSLSRQEGPLADFVEAHARRGGVQVGRFEDNVYAWVGDGEDLLLLNSHLDVVPPSEGHPYDPFDPVVKDGQLYGRGSVDAKASGAAMLTALLELAEDGWRPAGGKVMVALTTCEEIGADENGLEALRPHLSPIRAALVGEPTDLQPCVAQKGLLILRVEARGRSAHAARAHLGENAILAAAADLQRLQALTFDREDPFLGPVTVTPTVIEGGTARNVVPDRCVFYLDIRSTPAYAHEELVDLVSAHLGSEVHVHSKRLVPVSTPTDARIVRACRSALPGAVPFGSATMSDWLFLRDLPVVKVGPGLSPRSHTADEHIALAEVEAAVSAYKAIAQAFFALPPTP